MEEEVCISFYVRSTHGKGLYRSSRHLKPISLTTDLLQVLKAKNWHLKVTGIAIHRVKHHPFRQCQPRFFTAGDDLQYTLYSALYNEIFQLKMLRITTQSPYDTVSYCVHDIAWKSAMYYRISWNCDLGHAGGQCGNIVNFILLCEDYKNSSLA